MTSKILFVFLFLACALFAMSLAETQIPLSENWSSPYDVEKKSWGESFYITIPTTLVTSEIVIEMKIHDSTPTFDPDLYVAFGEVPTKSSIVDSSTTAIHAITLRSPEHTFVGGTKIYIGVFAYSNVGGHFKLRAQAYPCPGRGCGVPDRGNCIPADGVPPYCECKEGFTFLPNCNAQNSVLALDTKVDQTLEMGQIIYYQIELGARQTGKKYWFHTQLERKIGSGFAVIAIGQGHLPEEVPTTSRNTAMEWIQSSHTSASLLLDDNSYSQGKWTIAVFNQGKEPFGFSLTTETYNCPNKCSSHGTCQADSTCLCDEHYTTSPLDCSIRSDTLNFNEPQVIQLPKSDALHFAININKSVADSQLEVGIHLESLDANRGGTNWPGLFLNTKELAPTPLAFDFTSPRPATFNQTLYIPDTRVSEGKMTLALFRGNARDDVNYSLSLVPRPHCPTGCHENGYCAPFLTECVCFYGFLGGSCDISRNDCLKIRDIKTGISFGALAAIFFIILALSAGISAFIFAKFFYVAPSAPVPEMSYDPMTN